MRAEHLRIRDLELHLKAMQEKLSESQNDCKKLRAQLVDQHEFKHRINLLEHKLDKNELIKSHTHLNQLIINRDQKIKELERELKEREAKYQEQDKKTKEYAFQLNMVHAQIRQITKRDKSL